MSEQQSDSTTGEKPGTVGGGRAGRGPEPDPGGEVEPGGLVPPYDGRSTERGSSESSSALTESVEQQLENSDPGNRGATSSPAEERPVSANEVAGSGAAGSGDQTATDTSAATPLGVGESTTRRAEDIAEDEGKEPGRHDQGTADTPAQRPVGTSTARDQTGVDPQEPGDDA